MGWPLPAVSRLDGDNNMGISKTTLLNETTKALAKQTEYNRKIFALKGEAGGGGGTTDLNITVGNVQPATGLWFNTYTTFYSTYSTTATLGTNSNIDEYTKILLHFDESVTKDECGNTWTAYGSPTLSTNAKFGKALQLDGSSQYLTSSNNLSIGSQNWTLDFWINPSYGGNSVPILLLTSSDSPATVISLELYFSAYRINIAGTQANGTPSANYSQWTHLALVYQHDQNLATFYLNGTMSGIASVTLDNFTISTCHIGADATGSTFFTGYIDEFRFSNGIARWTEDFTPPTAPYGGVS